MVVFTSICTNYAHKARTLAESVKKNIPDAKFFGMPEPKEKFQSQWIAAILMMLFCQKICGRAILTDTFLSMPL